MAKKAKARLINVRLISMAMTGFFYTFKRPRTAPLMGMMNASEGSFPRNEKEDKVNQPKPANAPKTMD
ncbi:hypothetical protein ED733_008533 [Metarhizium rileyi]|uniref:Uncharacterized protein n=1 Tax=Metarhizium rileyi (strain RCEF 4871) TaxID=1649241 RepID=A0A5C6GMX8_METRR|nr:hypothetical protein ED733_008533 [Metarhizium rileyi]